MLLGIGWHRVDAFPRRKFIPFLYLLGKNFTWWVGNFHIHVLKLVGTSAVGVSREDVLVYWMSLILPGPNSHSAWSFQPNPSNTLFLMLFHTGLLPKSVIDHPDQVGTVIFNYRSKFSKLTRDPLNGSYMIPVWHPLWPLTSGVAMVRPSLGPVQPCGHVCAQTEPDPFYQPD